METNTGTSERYDCLQQIGRHRWELFYGYFNDGDTRFHFNLTFEYKPTLSEIRTIIIDRINAHTDEKILTGFIWKGTRVYLSVENQNNFKAAYDLNMQTGGALLPIKFKLGEDDEGNALYHTFEDMEDFSDFYMSAVAYINQCLNEGWMEKDGLDLTPYAG
jgi:hypothetical protein